MKTSVGLLLVLLNVVFGCDEVCENYHRWCDDLAAGQEPSNLSEEEAEIFAGQAFSCDEHFYQERCPMTCNECTPCETDSSDDGDDTYSSNVFGDVDYAIVGASFDAEKYLDGDLETCYDRSVGGYKSHIYLSSIQQVEIVAVRSMDNCEDCAKDLKDLKVKLCLGEDSNCDTCTELDEDTWQQDNYEGWIEYDCSEAAPGAAIQIQVGNNDDHVCEVKLGTKTYTELQVVSSSESSADVLFDGDLSTCYDAEDERQVYLKLDAAYEVSRVQVRPPQNCEDCGNNLDDLNVDVCEEDGSKCERCVKVTENSWTDDWFDDWFEFDCTKENPGQYIEIDIDDKTDVVCEVKIEKIDKIQ